jgi:hypothetical protein
MNKGDYLAIVFLAILAVSLFYFYLNLESFDCYIDSTFGNVMNDVEYEFEPQGSLYGKTRIYRFIISSPRSRLEYYGMNITNEDGETMFFENRTNPEGGSLVTTITLSNENENVTVERFFKKKCYEEVRL